MRWRFVVTFIIPPKWCLLRYVNELAQGKHGANKYSCELSLSLLSTCRKQGQKVCSLSLFSFLENWCDCMDNVLP